MREDEEVDFDDEIDFDDEQSDAVLRHLSDDLCRPDFEAADAADYRQIFAPFSYAGGKRLNVIPVWRRLGIDVANYTEAFMGGGAIFFGRPPNASGRRRRELRGSGRHWRAESFQKPIRDRIPTKPKPLSSADLKTNHKARFAKELRPNCVF